MKTSQKRGNTKTIDSTHEQYFEWWAEEAKNKGLIKKVERGRRITITPRQVVPYSVINAKGKTKETEKFLFHPHTYEWDYTIYWANDNRLHNDMFCLNSDSNSFFYSSVVDSDRITLVDIKPDRIGRNTQHSSITFPINQKLLYEHFGLYVQKVVLFPATNSEGRNKTLFTETWTPKKLITDDNWIYKSDRVGKWSKGSSKIKWKYKTIDQLF